jgi:hypothetical protein
MMAQNKVIKHLKGDIKTFKKEVAEDKELIRSMKKKKKDKENPAHEKAEKKSEKKVEKVMREFKSGKLHSGSKKGPKVKSRKQAIAIAMSEARLSKKSKKRK